jgi:hypothetical protein
MKKKFAAVIAVSMITVMMMGLTVNAATSPTTSATTSTTTSTTTPATTTPAATDANTPATSYANVTASNTVIVDGVEKTLTVTAKAVSVATLKAAQAQAASLVGANASVLQIVDVSLPAGTTFSKVQITFNVPGIVAGQSIYVLHQKADGTWEKITPDAVGNGTVTATFTSLSPVAIVAANASAQTGEAVPYALIGAIVCFMGVLFCLKKIQPAQA